MMNENIKLEYVAPAMDVEIVEEDVITTSTGGDFSYEGPIIPGK